jgi:Tfp pilus assembly protein PilX
VSDGDDLYDREMRRENRGIDLLYVASLIALVAIFGIAALRSVG